MQASVEGDAELAAEGAPLLRFGAKERREFSRRAANRLVATIDDKMRDEQARMHRLQYMEFELRGKIHEKIQSDAARSAAATSAATAAAASADPITADEYDAVMNKIKF